MDNIADRMRYAMSVKNISKEQLAINMNVRVEYIETLLKLSDQMSINDIMPLAKGLDVYPGWLIGMKVPMLGYEETKNTPEEAARQREESHPKYDFSKKLNIARLFRHLSANELANKLDDKFPKYSYTGIDITNFENLDCGCNNLEFLKDLSNVLEIDVRYFYKDAGPIMNYVL